MNEPSYAEARLERFGPIPWEESHRPPLPVLVRVVEPDEVTAARRAVLAEVPWREEEAA